MSAPKAFQAECPHCDETTTVEEHHRERRSAGSEMAARRGEYATVHEWTFRCRGCGQRTEKILDTEGILHKWHGNRHVTMEI